MVRCKSVEGEERIDFQATRLIVVVQYEAKEYLDILLHLVNISEAHPELLSAVGLCNFDSAHTEEACAFLIAKTGKAGIVSNQVQVSRRCIYDDRNECDDTRIRSSLCLTLDHCNVWEMYVGGTV